MDSSKRAELKPKRDNTEVDVISRSERITVPGRWNSRILWRKVPAEPLAKNLPVTPHSAQLHPANLLQSIYKIRLKRKYFKCKDLTQKTNIKPNSSAHLSSWGWGWRWWWKWRRNYGSQRWIVRRSSRKIQSLKWRQATLALNKMVFCRWKQTRCE